MYETSNQYMYDNYDKGYKPDEIMYRLHQLQGRIASTISDVKRAEDEISEKQSEILQEVDLIRLSVLDIDTKYSGEVTRLESSISITAGEIESKVTALNTRIGQAESTITQQATEISLKVSERDLTGNYISSLINQTATTIKIAASKVDIVGFVTFSDLNTNGRTTIHGGNILANTIAANSFYGNQFVVGNGVTTTKLTMTTTDSGSHTFHSNQAAGFRISSDGSLSLAAHPSYGIYTRNAPFVVENGFRVDGGISQFNTNVTVNATLNASTLQMNSARVATESWVATNFGGGSSSGVEWYDTYVIRRGGSAIKFLYGTATVQARNYYDSGWGNFEGNAYSNVSKREYKKDIEPYIGSVLDDIESTQVYSYRYNEDLDTEPKRIGLIYDESPLDIMQFRGGIDIYAMASMLWKGVQELYSELTALKERVEMIHG